MLLREVLRKWVGPAALLAGAGAAALVAPRLPHEHQVAFRLRDAATVTGVEVSWVPSSSADVVQAASWTFATGHAPPAVETRVSLPSGRYAVEVLVERGPAQETFRRLVTLGEADHITVPLQDTR